MKGLSQIDSPVLPYTRISKCARFATLVVSVALAAGALQIPTRAAEPPHSAGGSEAIGSLVVHPKAQILPIRLPRSVLVTDEGHLLIVENNKLKIFTDDGKIYSETTIVDGDKDKEGKPAEGRILKTGKGTIVLVYGDPTTRKLSWDRDTGESKADMRADVWMIRSTDGAKTWTDRQEISALFEAQSPYVLSLIQICQANDGTLIVPMQLRVGNQNRSVLSVAFSRDEGKTWQASSSVLDVGGAGVHDGLLEPAIVTLGDGHIWMLIRTNLDMFYESYSLDSGVTWSPAKPTAIAASSSPGYLLRLESGILMMLWNQLYPEGKTEHPRKSGKGTSGRPASWHREELSVSFSENAGKSWSAPVVIARDPKRAAYPSAIERRPGEIWVTTHHTTGKTFRFWEKDFVTAPNMGKFK